MVDIHVANKIMQKEEVFDEQASNLQRYYDENRIFFKLLNENGDYPGNFDLMRSIEMLLNKQRNIKKLATAKGIVESNIAKLKSNLGAVEIPRIEKHIFFLERVSEGLSMWKRQVKFENSFRLEQRRYFRESAFRVEFQLFTEELYSADSKYSNSTTYSEEIGYPIDFFIQQFLQAFELEVLPKEIKPIVLNWIEMNINISIKSFKNNPKDRVQFTENPNMQLQIDRDANPFVYYYRMLQES